MGLDCLIRSEGELVRMLRECVRVRKGLIYLVFTIL